MKTAAAGKIPAKQVSLIRITVHCLFTKDWHWKNTGDAAAGRDALDLEGVDVDGPAGFVNLFFGELLLHTTGLTQEIHHIVLIDSPQIAAPALLRVGLQITVMLIQCNRFS